MKAPFPDPSLASFVIVDDCEDDAFLLRHRLREAEFTQPIHALETVVKARAFLQRCAVDGETPALLFVDIRLPGVSGFDFIAELRGDPAWDSMRIVVVTNSNAPADLQRALALGADGYLIKFPPADLLGEFLRHGPWCETPHRRAALAHALSA